jgi:predicted nucleotidyltransferase
VTGGGGYDQLLPDAVELEVFGVRCRFVTLEKLIHLKRAAGRAKDLETVAQLNALLEERRKQDPPSETPG